MFDMNKSLEAGKMSLAAMLGIWLVVTILGFVPLINFVGGLLGLLGFFVLNPILLGYAGYVGTKKFGMDLTGAALTGGFVGFAASVIMGVANGILAMLGVTASAAVNGGMGGATGAVLTGGAILAVVVVAAVIGVTIHTVGGAVCGAIGSVIAGKK